MKALIISGALIVAAAIVSAAPRSAVSYDVIRLGSLGGAVSANSVDDRGLAAGTANRTGDAIAHAVVWARSAAPIDLGSFGGPDGNSAVAWPVKSNRGIIVGISDTADDHPFKDAFSCYPFYATGVPTRKICRGFAGAIGEMIALPPFAGGYDSYATGANRRGQIVGWAENGVHDPTCDPAFQVLQFRAVIWEPSGDMRELPPLPGDSTSAATAINDAGEVVGISGACGVAVGDVSARHAVIWEHGVPINIGDLGGHTWNTPAAINNEGTVVGFSLPADEEGTRFYHAFVWSRRAGIQRLNEFAGDTRSAALGVNAAGRIVGFSRSATAEVRAVTWDSADGTIMNLNDLAASASLQLVVASDINDHGVIVGAAVDPVTNTSPAFAAIPRHRD